MKSCRRFIFISTKNIKQQLHRNVKKNIHDFDEKKTYSKLNLRIVLQIFNFFHSYL